MPGVSPLPALSYNFNDELSTVGNYPVFSRAYLAAFSRTLYFDRSIMGGERSDGEEAPKTAVPKAPKKDRSFYIPLNLKINGYEPLEKKNSRYYRLVR